MEEKVRKIEKLKVLLVLE